MASTVSAPAMESPANPCCVKWQNKYAKMSEGRNHLRSGLKIMEERVRSLENDNIQLKKACEDQRNRADVMEKERENEASLRVSLENEVSVLKSEKCLTKTDADCKTDGLEKEIALLQGFVSEKDKEIERLKQLLAEKKPLAGAARKTTASEKKKVTELQKSLRHEKTRADEACEIADAAKKKSEEDAILVETLNNQVKNISQKLEEVTKMFEAEKQRVIDIKKKADEDKAIANELRKTVEVNEKKVAEEKCDAANLSMKLEEEKQKVENLQKKLQEVMLCEKSVLSSQLRELSENLEAEKEKVASECKRADLEKSEKVEQKKAAETIMKKAMEEKCRGDKLLLDLQSSRQRIESLQQELTKVNSLLEAEILVSAKEKQHVETLEVKLKEVQSALEVEKAQQNELIIKLDVENKKVGAEKRRADLEMSAKEEQRKVAEANTKNAMEEKLRSEKLSQELNCVRQKMENLEVELTKLNHMLEAERLLAAKERNHAEALNSKLDEQARIATENDKKATELECRCDSLIKELENANQKLKDVENQLCDVKQCRVLSVASPPDLIVSEQSAKVDLLQEQLKFEKRRVKHYKAVAEFEKNRNSSSQQELHKVKHDFECLLQQMDMLSDTFAARNHMNKKRRLNMQGTELPERMPCSSPPLLDFCGDAELRLSSLSSRDTSCHVNPNTGPVDAGQPMESPSGMKTNLDPLLGVSHGDILASSALNFNTESFSDEQLLGSQDRADGSLSKQQRLEAKDPNLQVTTVRWNDGARIATVAENCVNPTELDDGHVNKKRKIIDESKSIRCMNVQVEKVNQGAETNILALRNESVQSPIEQMEKVNVPVTCNNDKSCDNFGLSGKKRESAHESELALQQVNNSQITTNRREISQQEHSIKSDPLVSILDDLVNFEKEFNGDYMKLLDFDDAFAEEQFRMALEHPLSPLPDIYLHGFDKDVELQILGTPVCSTNSDTDPTGEHDKMPNFCVVFSDMGDTGSIFRIFCATRTCIGCLGSRLQTFWLVEDILLALVSDSDLIPREKVCVFFSLMLLNFVWASCGKYKAFQSPELSDSFSSHLQSVLLKVETRHLFAKVCSLSLLLDLCEDFLLKKKILLKSSLTSGLVNCDDSKIEILHQGENNVLLPNLASTNMVVAGSIILASIFVAAGLVSSLCEFSLKITRMIKTESSTALLILHTFAYVCGDEYFTNSNYHSAMEAVKCIVASAEASLSICDSNQPRNDIWHQFFPCDRCPFAGSSVCIEDVSCRLLKDLERCTNFRNQEDTSQLCVLISVLSSLELLAANTSWDWVCDKVVSKLIEILELCDPNRVLLTAVVASLANLGRLGVEAGGYNDPGVKSIITKLSDILQRTTSMKCNTLSVAIVHVLVELHPNGQELILKNNEDRSVKDALSGSDMMRMFSSLSTDQTFAIQSILNQKLPHINTEVLRF